MNDLIERQAAIDALQKEINKVRPPFDNVIGSIRCGVRLARNIIEDLPSAQPEIVRCKDCLMHGVCRFERGLGLDGYCSQAERRTE